MPDALYCTTTAISSADRPRYRALTDRIIHTRQSTTELSDGYALELDPAISLPEISEWLAFERACCPFLHFTLELRPNDGPNNGPTILTLHIPRHPHAKPFLRAEFNLP